MGDLDDFAMVAPARAADGRSVRAPWLPVIGAAFRSGAGAGFVGGAGCAVTYLAENAAELPDWALLGFRFLAFTAFMGAAFGVSTQLAVLAAERAAVSRVVAAAAAGAISGAPSGMIGGGYFGALPLPFVPATATAGLFLFGGSWVAFACATRARRRAGHRGTSAVLAPALWALACAVVLGVSALALAGALGQPSVIDALRAFQSIGLAWLGAGVGMMVGGVLGFELGVVHWLASPRDAMKRVARGSPGETCP
jgi:hypothetical protein